MGEGVHVYLAYYQRDELVLHELAASVGGSAEDNFNGSVFWEFLMDGNIPEVNSSITTSRGSIRSSLDFSTLDFQFATSSNAFATIPNGRIERSR